VKNFLRLARVAQHQETEAIKLWQILFSIRHSRWFPEKLRALYACRGTRAILAACIRLADNIVCIRTFPGLPNAAPLPRRFLCC
jgi:hypothetical protein